MPSSVCVHILRSWCVEAGRWRGRVSPVRHRGADHCRWETQGGWATDGWTQWDLGRQAQENRSHPEREVKHCVMCLWNVTSIWRHTCALIFSPICVCCTLYMCIPPLVLKARHLSGSSFCLIDIGLPEQAVGGFPLGLGLVVEDRPTELSIDSDRRKMEQIDRNSAPFGFLWLSGISFKLTTVGLVVCTFYPLPSLRSASVLCARNRHLLSVQTERNRTEMSPFIWLLLYVCLYFTKPYELGTLYNIILFYHFRESALAEMGIAVHKGETVGVFQPKKVN